MRVFCSAVLTGGLLLVGLDVFQARQGREASATGVTGMTATSMEDGTGLPPSNPPPPPPPQ